MIQIFADFFVYSNQEGNIVFFILPIYCTHVLSGQLLLKATERCDLVCSGLGEKRRKLLFALRQKMIASTKVFQFAHSRDRRDYLLCCNCKEEEGNIVPLSI